jgi:hypothetical protein
VSDASVSSLALWKPLQNSVLFYFMATVVFFVFGVTSYTITYTGTGYKRFIMPVNHFRQEQSYDFFCL